MRELRRLGRERVQLRHEDPERIRESGAVARAVIAIERSPGDKEVWKIVVVPERANEPDIALNLRDHRTVRECPRAANGEDRWLRADREAMHAEITRGEQRAAHVAPRSIECLTTIGLRRLHAARSRMVGRSEARRDSP